MTVCAPKSIVEVIEAVRASPRIVVRGSGSKTALSAAPDGATVLETGRLSGIVAYNPGEFVFTALAGTPLEEIRDALEENGQYLPCDPPWVDAGATLGGAIASGLNGSGRLRYGGLRDFILGVKFVDGEGRLLSGGGKVVKNAAGFDLPKLMVGSAGRLGAIAEATFKVFPRPRQWRSLRISCGGRDDAMQLLLQLYRLPLDLEALDFAPPGELRVRMSGEDESLAAHAGYVEKLAGRRCMHLTGEDDAAFWTRQREFLWCDADDLLIKVALTPGRVTELEGRLRSLRPLPERRYAVAGNVAWIAWPADRAVSELPLDGFRALIVRSPAPAKHPPRLGAPTDATAPFAARIKQVLDPPGRFPPLI